MTATQPVETRKAGLPDRRYAERGGLAPFLKWVGGKRSLLPQLLELVPARIKTYCEPFVGGGALFFELARLGRFDKAKLADCNEELIHCYRAIKDDFRKVVRALEKHTYGEEAFYAVRDLEPKELTDFERAARTIYLNRCGYNGLYRVNSKGKFNVPFGHYRNPRLVHPKRLELVSQALQRAQLSVADFQDTVAKSGPDDFIYFDPPYVALSPTANFTAYARLGFDAGDQDRLATLLRRLGEQRIPALLSNSDCGATRQLYSGLRIDEVQVRRAVNSNAAKRGPVSELLVRSFEYAC